jgi:phage terminase Nu1 subunit (DNA packaging protein)
MTRSESVNVRLDKETFARLTKAARSQFEKPSAVAAEMLCKLLKKDLPPEATEASLYVQMKEREQKAKTEMAELELARQRGEFVRKDRVIEFMAREYGVIRSIVLAIPYSDPTLTSEQIANSNRNVQDALTALCEKSPAAVKQMADDEAADV